MIMMLIKLVVFQVNKVGGSSVRIKEIFNNNNNKSLKSIITSSKIPINKSASSLSSSCSSSNSVELNLTKLENQYNKLLKWSMIKSIILIAIIYSIGSLILDYANHNHKVSKTIFLFPSKSRKYFYLPWNQLF